MIKITTPQKPMLNTREAAAFLGLSEAFLARDRWKAGKTGDPPDVPFIRVTQKNVRYLRSDLEALLEAKRVS